MQSTTYANIFSFNNCPDAWLSHAFSFLSFQSIIGISRVSVKWQKVSSQDDFRRKSCILEFAIGSRKWMSFSNKGCTDEELALLPKNIHKILLGPSISFPGKRVMQVERLVFIPKGITFKMIHQNFLEIVKNGVVAVSKTQVVNIDICKKTFKVHGNTPTTESTWLFITKKVIPGSVKQNYDTQIKLVSSLATKAKEAYEVPSPTEILVGLLGEFSKTGRWLFIEQGTRSNLKINDRTVYVEADADIGPVFKSSYNYASNEVGIAAVRKLKKTL